MLGRDGADLALTYNRRQEAAQALSLMRYRLNATIHKCDARERADSIHEMIADVIAKHGRIHTLIWAAGPLVEQYLLSETPMEAWRQAFEVEVHGLFGLFLPCCPTCAMQAAVRSSIWGRPGICAGQIVMGSQSRQGANESWLKGIAREEGRHGIRANSVLVGVIDAGMFHELMAKGAFPESWVEETRKMLSVKRWGQPEEIGYAVSWLASSRAAYVTGQQINVSGGFRALGRR